MAIQCVFDVGTNPNDAMLEINNRVRTAERTASRKVRDQGVSVRKRSEDELLMMALYSPDKSMTASDMADYANLNIVDELKRLPASVTFPCSATFSRPCAFGLIRIG